jgi:phage terminase small subunit
MAEPLPVLTPQEQTFVEEYAKDRNQVRAALAARLSESYFAAAQAARALLKKPQIRTAVKYVLKQQARRLKTEVPDVVREWAVLAKSDVTDYVVTGEGEVTVRPGVPRSALRAVKKVKQTRTERLSGAPGSQELTVEIRTEIELHAKEGPLGRLYEHLHGVLPGESPKEIPVEVAARLLALAGRTGVPAVADAVGAEPGAAEPRVPE